jgi:hypothetical protein
MSQINTLITPRLPGGGGNRYRGQPFPVSQQIQQSGGYGFFPA